MVAPDHNGCLDLAFLDQIIDGQTELRSLAVSEPADPRRQSLKLDALARQIDPAVENAVLWEQLQHQIVGHGNIGGIAGKRRPTERPASLPTKRTNICRNKPGKIVAFFRPCWKANVRILLP